MSRRAGSGTVRAMTRGIGKTQRAFLLALAEIEGETGVGFHWSRNIWARALVRDPELRAWAKTSDIAISLLSRGLVIRAQRPGVVALTDAGREVLAAVPRAR